MPILRSLALGLAMVSLPFGNAVPVLAQSVAAPQQANDPVSLRAEAFEAAQLAVTTAAAAALTKVAAAFSKGGDRIAQLERQRDDLIRQLDASERQYMSLLGEQPADRIQLRNETAARADKLRSDIQRIERDISAVDPSYFELTRPRALSVAETQALLNPDEAVLLLLVSDDATYVFGVSRDRIEWARAPDLGEAALTQKVAEIRRGLDGTGELPPFPRKTAYALYSSLVKPVESVFAGKRVLMSVATGPLGALPLQLLVTDPPQGSDGDPAALQSTHYLVDRYAMTMLPAVSSLQALRCLLVAPERRHPGCGKAVGVARPAAPAGSVSLVGYGAPSLLGDPRTARGGTIVTAFNGPLADTDALRKMAFLPGSRRELDKLARDYGDRAHIHVGDEATEGSIKRDIDLRQARYVIFSTHGLLAGQVGVIGEPGLVFTPPVESAKSEDDDGLLTASEAARLQLRADFVVLSACNTAAADGTPGGDGLSGLARSFFYAGARSLLVSHWTVDDAATARLIPATFDAFDKAGSRDRAEALRAGIAAVRANPKWSSPRYWGAFTLVGVPD